MRNSERNVRPSDLREDWLKENTAMKTIDYYMSLPYRIEIKPDPSEGGFTAWYPDLPGCVTTADTMEKVLQNAVDAKRSWLEAAIADGIEIKAI